MWKGLRCVRGRRAGGGGGNRVGAFVRRRWWWLLVVERDARWRGVVCWLFCSGQHVSARVALWIRRLPPKEVIVGSSPTSGVGVNEVWDRYTVKRGSYAK